MVQAADGAPEPLTHRATGHPPSRELPGPTAARLRTAALVAGAVVIAGYYLLPKADAARSAVLSALAAAAALSTAHAAVRMAGLARRCWTALAAGMALSSLAAAASSGTTVVTRHALPFPSWPDALGLAAAPCFVAALVVIAVGRRGSDPLGDVLDASMIAVGGGGLLTGYVLLPATHGSSGTLAQLVAVLHPAADLVLLALLVPLLLSHRQSRPLLLVGASFTTLLTGDVVQAVSWTAAGGSAGRLAPAFWLAAYVLMAVAPLGSTADELTPAALDLRPSVSNGRWALLAAALVAGPVLLVGPGTAMLGLAVSAVLLVLVVLRLTQLNGRLVQAGRDVRDKHDQLRHQSMHDALTGLPNRMLIAERIEWMLGRPRHVGSSCATLLVDLDGFKHVNDTRGHEAGDRLLQAVAGRLAGALREVDSIGRVGGDEFAVLIDEVELGCAPELVAARIVEVLRLPFDLDDGGPPVTVTTSIGIAAATPDDPSDLLRDADVALNQAKASGTNGFEVFAPEMERSVQRRYEIELDLRTALADGQFELLYLPIYDLDALTLVGLEALLRWNHPVRGQLGPEEFVPVLESSDQILEVGRWALLEACRQMARWRAGGSDLGVSVNVSPRQLDRDVLVDHVRDCLADTGLDPAALTLEVTETALMRNVQETARRLGELKQLGVQLAIDDFGTGYSSLAYLQQFPVDCLKIDRTFTDALSRSPESDALIHTLVQLGKDLGLRTLADGVETSAQMSQLQRENVNAVQGFLFAAPMTVAAVDAVLDRRGGQPATTPAGEG